MMNEAQYQQLYVLSTALHIHGGHLERSIEIILKHVCLGLGTDQAALLTLDQAGSIDHVRVTGMDDTPQAQQAALWEPLLQMGLLGYIRHGGSLTVVRDMQADPRWLQGQPDSVFPQHGSAAGIPLQGEGGTFGILVSWHPDIDFFTEDKLSFLRAAGHTASAALGNAIRWQQQREGASGYQVLFEHTLVPMLRTTLDGTIVDVNEKASEFLGFHRGALLGVPLDDINIVIHEKHDLRQIAPNQEQYFRASIYDIHGQEIPCLVRVRHLLLEGERSIEWMLQDISTQMELEQLRRDLTSMVYHDLRGPLGNIHTVILTLGRTLAQKADATTGRLLELGLRSTQRLQRLVDGLLDIQRLEDGNSMLQRQQTEVRPLLVDVYQLAQPLAAEAKQKLHLEASPHLPLLYVDLDMIGRVMINLIENAIKYTPDGGDIYITAEQQGRSIVLGVRDSGPGIPQELQGHIFDKFSRLRHDNAPKGTGLGLAFCRLAVEAHGGRIWVESDGTSGSNFKVALPLPADSPDDEEDVPYATSA